MQSHTNKFNHSLPSISFKKQPTKQVQNYNKNFELNNQGCKCELCQKLIINQNLKINEDTEAVQCESQKYSHGIHKEGYINLLQQMTNKWKYKRSLRFMLPQTCLYQNGQPTALIQKKKQSLSISICKSKSKLHFFQIQNFFLSSYICHNPQPKPRKSSKQSNSLAYLHECILLAKYHSNTHHLLTFRQIQNLFKSKYKYMRDNLMYLQTIVGGDNFRILNVKVHLKDINANQTLKQLWDRAKKEVRILLNEIKTMDKEYYDENHQISFENQLKQFDINHYLLYLSYKIILINSKTNDKGSIIKSSVFKYNIVDKKVYFLDLRIIQSDRTQSYWSSSNLKALQIKLQKTMSMMQLPNPQQQKRYQINELNLSHKANQLSKWLSSSTEDQWTEMKVIRSRLEKLQQEKISLQRSKIQQSMKRSIKDKINLKNQSARKNSQIEPYIRSQTDLSHRV